MLFRSNGFVTHPGNAGYWILTVVTWLTAFTAVTSGTPAWTVARSVPCAGCISFP
mgnify:FL=1